MKKLGKFLLCSILLCPPLLQAGENPQSAVQVESLALGDLSASEINVISGSYGRVIPGDRLEMIIRSARNLGEQIILKTNQTREQVKDIALNAALQNYQLNFARKNEIDWERFELGTVSFMVINRMI
jgi:hypothetical protein